MPELLFFPVLNPPLGTTTQVNTSLGVSFTAIINISIDATIAGDITTADAINPDHRFTVLLWYSYSGSNSWNPAPFTEITDEEKASKLLCCVPNKKSSTLRRDLFTITDFPIAPPSTNERGSIPPLQFCLKYRFHDGPWLWAGSRIGQRDGRIVFFQPQVPLPFYEPIFPGFYPWIVDRVYSDSDTDLYHLHADVSVTSQALGKPTGLEKWMAMVKIALPWMGPLHGGRNWDCEKDAMMFLGLRDDGTVVSVLPVPESAGVTPYLVAKDGEIVVRRSEGFDHLNVVVGVGNDAQKVLDQGISLYQEMVIETGNALPWIENGVECAVEEREEWERGVGYCTWNSLGANLSHERIMDALQSLVENDIKVTNVIIDDNWQTLDNAKYTSSGTMSRFEANHNFPSGLSGLASEIRQKYPHIKHIAVWHALLGYWDGITPDSELAREYKTIQCAWKDNVTGQIRDLTFIHPSDVERFFDDFYRFLSQSGIDSVKVDVQSRIDELQNSSDKDALLTPYQDALFKAANKYFSSRVIYCMSHIPIILSQLSTIDRDRSPNIILRSSDDFYPSVPETHTNHIFSNAHNTHFFSRLPVVQDWDMFSTGLSPKYSSLHAAARVLSGGPKFITDTPGTHNPDIVKMMQEMGLEKPAVNVYPFRGKDEGKLLVMQGERVNENGENEMVLGVFNLGDKTVGEIVIIHFGDIMSNVRSYRSGEIGILGKGGIVYVELEEAGWDLLMVGKQGC